MNLYRIFFMQCCFITLLALVLLSVWGSTPAISAMIGGVAYLIPSAYFAWRALGEPGESAELMLRRMYVGEVGKLFLTAAIFALGFIFIKPLQPSIVFAVFFMMIGIGIVSMACLPATRQQ